MDNFITIAVSAVFLLLVYTYATGKIEKRKNRKAEKKAGRLLPAAEKASCSAAEHGADVFTECRVLFFTLSGTTLRDVEMCMTARINTVIHQIEDLGGYDIEIAAQQPYVDDIVCVILTCKRPHLKNEG